MRGRARSSERVAAGEGGEQRSPARPPLALSVVLVMKEGF